MKDIKFVDKGHHTRLPHILIALVAQWASASLTSQDCATCILHNQPYHVSIHVWKQGSHGTSNVRVPARRQHRPCPRRRWRGPPFHELDVSLPIQAQVESGNLTTNGYSYPLITLSTRAQVESKRAQSSTYDAIRRIVQREGITGLYSGLDSALFGITVTNFVYYYCTKQSSNTSSVNC